jgi:hypothetical protein
MIYVSEKADVNSRAQASQADVDMQVNCEPGLDPMPYRVRSLTRPAPATSGVNGDDCRQSTVSTGHITSVACACRVPSTILSLHLDWTLPSIVMSRQLIRVVN